MQRLVAPLLLAAVVTLVSLTDQAKASGVFTIDNFSVELNGQLLFNDTFGDNVAPPNAPNYLFPAANNTVSYNLVGTISEANGRAVLNALNNGEIAQNVYELNSYINRAMLPTPIDPTANRNLGTADTFKVTGLYDLSIPGARTEDYRIRLTDRSTMGENSYDSLDLRVQRTLDGQVSIRFLRVNYACSPCNPTELGSATLDLTGKPDQIQLNLAKLSAGSNEITASFSYLKDGQVLSSTTFQQTASIFNDTDYTRAMFLSQIAQNAVDPNIAVRMQTGSPVTLSQNISTGGSPFTLSFDYQFETTTGELTVTINGVEIGKLTAPGTLSGLMQTYSILVTNAALFNLVNVALAFTLDGPTGSKMLLDNIVGLALANAGFQTGNVTGWNVSGPGSLAVTDLSEVPVPGAFALYATGLGLMGWVTWRRKRKTAFA